MKRHLGGQDHGREAPVGVGASKPQQRVGLEAAPVARDHQLGALREVLAASDDVPGQDARPPPRQVESLAQLQGDRGAVCLWDIDGTWTSSGALRLQLAHGDQICHVRVQCHLAGCASKGAFHGVVTESLLKRPIQPCTQAQEHLASEGGPSQPMLNDMAEEGRDGQRLGPQVRLLQEFGPQTVIGHREPINAAVVNRDGLSAMPPYWTTDVVVRPAAHVDIDVEGLRQHRLAEPVQQLPVLREFV